MSYYDTIEWDIKRAREIAAKDPQGINSTGVVLRAAVKGLLESLADEVERLQAEVNRLSHE